MVILELMEKKIALVLGGSGLIGREVVRKMAQDYSVTSLDKVPQLSANVSYRKFDITDPEAFESIVLLEPGLIINCINVATIFSGSPTQHYPSLIGFYLDLYKALRRLKPPIHYIQIGTTGSGGLGLNIPFTHGGKLEELPIINKAAFAGIGTSMLTMLSRSFGNERVRISEVKPGLAIFDDKIHHPTGDKWDLVTVDGGESGHYTLDEFQILTSFMGFTTAQKVAEKVFSIIEGCAKERRSSSYDVIEALNQTIVSEDKEDLEIRDSLLERMEKASRGNSIIATGNLGPPSLTRDLILASIALTHQCNNEADFKKIFAESVSCTQTLTHISSVNKDLGNYLKSECNYENYRELQKLVANHHFTHPWQLVAGKLRSVTIDRLSSK